LRGNLRQGIWATHSVPYLIYANEFTVARIAISPASRLAVEPMQADVAAQQRPLQGSACSNDRRTTVCYNPTWSISIGN